MRRAHRLLAGLLAAVGTAALPSGCASRPPAPSSWAVFTSEIADGEPVDRLERASFGQRKVLLRVPWFDLPEGPREATMDSVTGHWFAPVLDAPGQWTFRAYVDGVQELELRPPGPYRVRVFLDGELRGERTIGVTAD